MLYYIKIGKAVNIIGKTSCAVKDRWNAKAYDAIALRVAKGQKEVIKSHANQMGESVNGFITRAISEQMKRDEQAER